jgi:tRNA threonylcarbamoyladenosine biosynthesis protein TsaB
MILTLRTDKPEAEIGLFEGSKQLTYHTWQAHRQLAETIHTQIDRVLSEAGKSLKDVTGIIVYQGPGSFTGLRIGMSVANALAYALPAPVAATSGSEWIQQGINRVQGKKQTRTYPVPEYGSPAHVTSPKK